MRPEIKLGIGRMFRPTTHELIVGKSVLTQLEGLTVGARCLKRHHIRLEWRALRSNRSAAR